MFSSYEIARETNVDIDCTIVSIRTYGFDNWKFFSNLILLIVPLFCQFVFGFGSICGLFWTIYLFPAYWWLATIVGLFWFPLGMYLGFLLIPKENMLIFGDFEVSIYIFHIISYVFGMIGGILFFFKFGLAIF